ncbi:MAG TPA: SDR family NAD(P)-dependent oxidoreductase, partial [Prolixibacteraceae bacterium]
MKKVSVISGGAGGMGRAVAKELGKYSTVVLGDINPDRLQEAKKELDDLGVETCILQMDVRDAESVKQLASLSASLGEVVNIIHTAGLSPTDSFADAIISTN